MGCFGDREKGPHDESQKWDFITLSDFRCTSAWTVVAYIWLWFMALVGVAVYVADTYTAVNLLAFDEWSSQVKPALDIKYSKWIFAVCIMVSWVLCFYEWFRAVRVVRRGGVAESFLDPLAVNLQSMRPKGWKRFLVFTELTKSKKGADYVALFVYFSFKTAFRVILAEGPRQVVNGMTLYAVLRADLLGTSQERNAFDQFWYNVEQLADHNNYQAVIYFTMLFTLIIWVFSALSLIISGILYIVFLWHYIPQRDGRLSVYCRRKVDRRLEKIVEHKVKAAIEEEERRKHKAERKAELKRQKTGELPPPVQPYLKPQPTLPDLGDFPDLRKEDRLPEFPLVRQDTNTTVSTLPPYSSRPPTRNGNPGMQRQPTLPEISPGERPGMPMRSDTQASSWSAAPSYSTHAPLLDNAGYAGGVDDMPAKPPSAVSRQDSYLSFSTLPFHGRTDSQSTQASRRAFTSGPRTATPMSARPFTPTNGPGYGRATPAPRIPLPVRSNTAYSFDQDPQSAPSISSSQDGYGRSYGPPTRSNTADGFRPPPMQQNSETSFSSLHSQQSFSRPGRKPTNGSFNRSYTPASLPGDRPASPLNSYEMTAQPTHTLPALSTGSGYVAFNPSMHSATPAPTLQEGPRRNITVAGPPGTGDDYFGSIQHEVPQRSATAPIEPRHSNYAHDILDEYDSPGDEGIRRPSPPNSGLPRANTAGPQAGQWRAF